MITFVGYLLSQVANQTKPDLQFIETTRTRKDHIISDDYLAVNCYVRMVTKPLKSNVAT